MADKKVKGLIAQRDNVITQLSELKLVALQAHTDSTQHMHFKIRCKGIENILSEFNSHHAAILNIVAQSDDADLETHRTIRRNFDNDYYEIQTIYTELFEDGNDKKPQGWSPSHVKLPKLELRKFDGSIKNWRTFIDLFDSMVHRNPSLSCVEKFSYLINSLEGPPLGIVQCNPLTDDNYLIAYNTLKDRYENTRLISISHWREIEKSKKLPSDHDVHSLQKLVDTFTEHLSSLKNLGHPTDHWDFILFHMLFDRLDQGTGTRFELECGHLLEDAQNKDAHFQILLKFLRKQCLALETIAQSSPKLLEKYSKSSPKLFEKGHKPRTSLLNSKNLNKCPVCTQVGHSIYRCSKFLDKTPEERYRLVKDNKWCTNCLGTGHYSQCSSAGRCTTCSKPHHSLLHFNRKQFPFHNNQVPPSTIALRPSKCDAETQSAPLTTLKAEHASKDNIILLATAQIRVMDSHGNPQLARVILDSASQVNFITSKLCSRLALSKRPLSLFVKGLGNTRSNISQEVTCTFFPKNSLDPQFTLDFAVIPQICDDMPPSNLSTDNFSQFSHLNLADDKYNISSPVDMLLGCDVVANLLREGHISQSINQPVALNTHLGWIIMGRVPLSNSARLCNTFCSTLSSSLDESVKRFWQLEEVPHRISQSPDDVAAEKIYAETHSRNISGKYIVQLPFRDLQIPSFQNSRQIALRRFHSLERRLLANPQIYEEYRKFMQDYRDSGHMESVSPGSRPRTTYYIPHHCILRPESSTTKLRVVFDASCRASDNISLNDTLLIGPKLQQDIFSLLLRFRTYAFVFTADIKQMFRNILVHESHRDFQRILWRSSTSEPIQDFRLCTVTYGIASSPFQAIRTLIQLARDYRTQFPRASEVLEGEIYVDDILSGTNCVQSALSLQKELIELLALGGFELRKWASNTPLLLTHLDDSLSQYNALSLDKETPFTVKILGLQWNPLSDSFTYSIDSKSGECTKRNVLSNLARIFDPLGFLSPITVSVKLIIQELWSSGLGWDDPAPSSLAEYWSSFQNGLPLLSELSIDRKAIPPDARFCELHGFCDSSERAYSAVIYLRAVSLDNQVNTLLLCSKTRVAPLKKISIPRLELCSAVLLADLISAVSKALQSIVNTTSIFAWTDSTVCLSWIRSSPHKWTTFVSNRVTYIQEKIPPSQWFHVVSEENPADCATRGLMPSEILHLAKWWAGPNFLADHHERWFHQRPIVLDERLNLERRKTTLQVATHMISFWDNFIEKYSSLSKMNRIFAYLLRFVNNSLTQRTTLNGPPTLVELERALLHLIKLVQSEYFAKEISELRKPSPNLKSFPKYFRKLTPFLDKDEVLRVGGRLSHSSLSYDHRHPCLLPSNHKLTRLIIESTHVKYLHPGFQATQFLISQRYWIPSSRRIIRKVLSSCSRCFRCAPYSQTPLMGELPSPRVNQVKCFTKSGVDLGGPFLVTMSKSRGSKSSKSYICLFVCLATKALHLELVTALSTDALLAALRRFMSRRGTVTDIYSDCGTNFLGASKQLITDMHDASLKEGIRWHFNPPSAPNFGGIWEAGIKAVKKHIARVIGTQILTYEEFYTVLTSIEAVLNSRPLCAMSSDPNDLSVLTPGHFLNLEPLNSFIEPDLTDVKIGRLSRWQLLQRMHQDFWKRWHAEYLHTLNQRSKWYDPATAIKDDVLVLIKDDTLPPLMWQLGRVMETYPGADGITRVVSVKTKRGILKRPVSKLCPLPDY